MSLCLTFNLSIGLPSLSLSFSLSLFPSVSLSLCLFVWISICPPLSCLSFLLSLCVSFYLSHFFLFLSFFSLLDNYILISADGTWAQWSTWSKCVPHCGDGTTMRERICLGHPSGRRDCEGESKQVFDCKDDATCTGS